MLNQLLISKLTDTGDAYLSVIERKDGVFCACLQRVYIFFTRFTSCTWGSQRYVVSRYYLIRLVKKLGLSTDSKYCFSHSRKYSAVVFSPCIENLSVDIEPAERRLPESLRAKVKTLYPDVLMPELVIIMILESLVKLSVFDTPFCLSMGLSKHCSAKISSLDENIFEVIVSNKKVYSRIYRFDSLYICVTREENQFPPSL